MFRHAGASLVATVIGALTLAPASFAADPVGQTLNPPPQPYETCKAVGGGTICAGGHTVTYAPVDTGIACGSAAGAFDIFDQGSFTITAIRYYDLNGNLTRRVIHFDEQGGHWSNTFTGATLSYTQRYVQTDVLAVPGDLTSSTETITGENIYRAGTGAPVMIATGRQVYNFDQSELFFSAGRNDFVDVIFEGNPAPLERVCAALAG